MGKQLEAIKLAIKDELLGKFRAMRANAGDILPSSWLHDDYLPSLSTKEEKAFEEIINEMLAEGLIEYIGGPKPTYRLTEKGKNILC